MTKRQEVLKFAALNGMTAKGVRGGAAHGVVSLYKQRTKGQWQDAWVDYFENWDAAHTFLLSAVTANRDTGKPLPWS